MPLADWTVPFSLTSALYSGSPLAINTAILGSGIYLLRPDGCALRCNVRAIKDDMPQADGTILHRRFLTGMEMDLTFQLWETTDLPACNELAQVMLDDLLAYLRALRNAGDNEGRISWTPQGEADRMLDDIRLLTYPEETLTDAGVIEITATVDTPYPYSMNLAEDPVALVAGNNTVPNSGNTETWPVFRIDGAATVFVLTNVSTGKAFHFNANLPGGVALGGGDYAEIDMFRNTIYLNGSGANLKPSVDMLYSEFFSLSPGNNTINLAYDATSGTALVNAAWA